MLIEPKHYGSGYKPEPAKKEIEKQKIVIISSFYKEAKKPRDYLINSSIAGSIMLIKP